jgi:hypothetical protein
MTANKHFKRKVRERARRTGESYTAALRHLRHDNAREHLMQSHPVQCQPMQCQPVQCQPMQCLSAAEHAERVQASLEAAGFGDFEITEAEVAGQPGARLDCAKRDAGRTWAVREYFASHDDAHFVLGCGSAVPDEDDALFTQIAERFEILGG